MVDFDYNGPMAILLTNIQFTSITVEQQCYNPDIGNSKTMTYTKSYSRAQLEAQKQAKLFKLVYQLHSQQNLTTLATSALNMNNTCMKGQTSVFGISTLLHKGANYAIQFCA